jgi:hypothetical protein
MSKPTSKFLERIGRSLLAEDPTPPPPATPPATPPADATPPATPPAAPAAPTPPPSTDIAATARHGLSAAEILAGVESKPADDAPATPPATAPTTPPATPPSTPPVEPPANQATPPVEPPKPSDPPVVTKPRATEPPPEIPADDFEQPPSNPEPVSEQTLAELLGYEPTAAEEEHLEVLRYAAKTDPKFVEVFNREVARLKKVNEFATKWKAEHEDEDPDPQDPEYRKLLKAHPPAVDASTMRRLERKMIVEQTASATERRVLEAVQPKLKKVEEIEQKPQIEKLTGEFTTILLQQFPEQAEIRKVASEKGVDALAKEVPVLGKHAASVIVKAQGAAQEYLRIRRSLVEFNPRTGTNPEGNPVHTYLANTVNMAAEIFQRDGGADRIRDGKTFLPPAKFAQLKESARSKYWTFDEEDVLTIIAVNCATNLDHDLRSMQEELNAYDARKKPATPPAEPPKAPAEPPPQSPRTVSPPMPPPSTPGNSTPKISRLASRVTD